MDHSAAVPAHDLKLMLHRRGFAEECYFSFSYSPIRDETGSIGGVFCPVIETTDRVLGERRLRLLRDLAASQADLRTTPRVCAAAASCLDGEKADDFPATAFYLPDGTGEQVRLASSSGPAREWAAFAEILMLGAGGDWPLAAATSARPSFLAELRASPCGRFRAPADDRPKHAFLHRLASRDGSDRAAGFLVALPTPHRPADELGSLISLVAAQVEAGLAHAAAHEEERRRTVAEAAAREAAERRLTFLLDLESRLRDVADPAQVKQMLCERLAPQMGVALLGYSEADATGEFVLVERAWSDGSIPSLAGSHRLEDYGPGLIADLRQNRAVRVEDVRADPRTAGQDVVAAYETWPIAAFLCVPLTKGGQLAGILFALSPSARAWTDDEVALLRSASERAWSAIGRARAETALRVQQAQLAAVVETVPAAIWFTHDADASRAAGNRMAVEMFRMAPNANPSLSAMADDRPGHFRVLRDGVEASVERLPLQRAARGEEVPTEEHEIVFHDGTSATILTRATPLRDASGAVTGAVASAIDITDRKLIEAMLRKSEQEFRSLGENLPSLCWMAGADGWIYWYNRRWYEYTGTTPEDMQGWGWQSVHDPEALPTVLLAWTSSIAAGTPFEMTLPLRGADGVLRPFLTRVVPVRDEDGIIKCWFGTNVDISDQQRTEAALRESQAELMRLNADLEGRVRAEIATREQSQERLAHAQRMEALGQLAGGIAHDFNNVLQAVTGGLR